MSDNNVEYIVDIIKKVQSFNNNVKSFLALVKVGLWADIESMDIRKLGFSEPVDWQEIYKLAEEQSVIGVVLAGIERLKSANVCLNLNQELLLQWIGEAQMIEQQNLAMNRFIATMVKKMRGVGIYTLLVKGQGVAQCYERPLWRTCGDVDFYLSESNYNAAKDYIKPMAQCVIEDKKRLHYNTTIDSWTVELHGTLHNSFSKRINKGLDDVHHDIFYGGEVRSWQNNSTTVFLPSADNDVVIIFAHIIQHFYIGGIGLRQICDWCRLLWTYKNSLNHGLLEKRIQKMGLISEWHVFASLAVDFLDMPVEAMPLYDEKKCYQRKAKQVMDRIIRGGNLGHNSDETYRAKYSGFKSDVITFFRRLCEFVPLTMIFPLNAPQFFISYVFGRIK